MNRSKKCAEFKDVHEKKRGGVRWPAGPVGHLSLLASETRHTKRLKALYWHYFHFLELTVGYSPTIV